MIPLKLNLLLNKLNLVLAVRSSTSDGRFGNPGVLKPAPMYCALIPNPKFPALYENDEIPARSMEDDFLGLIRNDAALAISDVSAMSEN